jgi:hypothetical protein
MLRFVTANSGGNWHPDREDPGHLRWWDGSQWTEARRPDPAAGPAQSLTSPAGPAGASSKGWLIWGGAVAVLAVIVVITLVVAIHHGSGSAPAAQSSRHSSGSGSAGSGSASQSQECQSVVDPLYQLSVHGTGTSSGNYPQAISSFRQAARRVSSDPLLANDLNAMANGLQKEENDLSSSSVSNSAIEHDMSQEGLDMSALMQICPP